MSDWSREARNSGNPNHRPDKVEESRVGRSRAAEDIPAQGKTTRFGFKPGNANPSTFQSSTIETKGRYRIGASLRPNITFDNGFLDYYPRRAPTAEDYLNLAKWKLKLEAGEALRPDLTDALGAYRHFLQGNGVKRAFSYERYVATDMSGQATLRNAILDFQDAVLDLYLADTSRTKFEVTGPPIPCGADFTDLPYVSANFPYPDTENWQKTIGGHVIWLSGLVQVSVNNLNSPPEAFRCTMDLHAEDRYNFNPDAEDMATGIPDSDNGVFELTGLGMQFDSYASLRRILQWKGFDLGVGLSVAPHTTRLRQPQNNRRARNRV